MYRSDRGLTSPSIFLKSLLSSSSTLRCTLTWKLISIICYASHVYGPLLIDIVHTNSWFQIHTIWRLNSVLAPMKYIFYLMSDMQTQLDLTDIAYSYTITFWHRPPLRHTLETVNCILPAEWLFNRDYSQGSSYYSSYMWTWRRPIGKETTGHSIKASQ